MRLPSIRYTFLIISLGTLGLMLTGYYMQFVMKLIPCPLCITQRFFIIGVGITALAAFFHQPQKLGRRLYASLGAVLAIIGGGFSSRQVWLQSLPPDQVPACGPDLSYLIENFPLKEAFMVLVRGDGNCAEVTWTFLGVSIAGWTLVAFSGLL
ncbi:MAG TPA: disulfide bond formation protein B, partial [Cellvibrionaceae bacterium]|nr:disulfide bond formation protein B [Cellvibrionaceae bacterium]